MARVLINFAHPALEKSRVHKRLIKNLQQKDGITFHDLYEAYPDLDIDVSREKELLLGHHIIILQHPFYWYSAPAMIKQWEDLVLEHGWAYGHGGTALTGKKMFNCISCGGSREAYTGKGRNRFTIRQLLAPFDQTAYLCHMRYLPPFAIHGTHRLIDSQIEEAGRQYEQLIDALISESINDEDLERPDYLNDLALFSTLQTS